MKRLLIILFLLTCPVLATTKLRLHATAAAVAGYKAMDISLGPKGAAVTTSVTTTTAAGNDIQATATGGGSTLAWITEPLSSTTTISGTITFNFYAKESATSVNSTIRPTLILYHGGAETTTITNCGFATELTASIAAKNWSTASGGWTACSVTSTTIAVGDRLVLKVFVNGCTTSCTVAGGGMAAGSVTIDYEGGTDAADGSSWVQLNETETFSQESAGNMILVSIGSNPGTGWSVADDGGNTYNVAAFCSPTGFVVKEIFYALNVVAARKITVTHTSGTVDYFSATAMEVTNIPIASALDVSTSNCNQTGTTVTAGSFTPNYSGDFIYQTVSDGNWPPTAPFSTATQGSCAWSLLDTKMANAEAGQYCDYNSTSALNPTLTRNETGLEWYSLAVAFKQSGSAPVINRWVTTPNMSNTGQLSSAGGSMTLWLPDPALTATTGMYMAGVTNEVWQVGSTSPQTLQFTHTGNLVIIGMKGGVDDHPTSISSTPSHTWTATSSDIVSASVHANSIIYCSDTGNTGTETLSITMTMNQTAISDDDYFVIDVKGAKSTACADAASHSGFAIGNKTGVTPIDVSSGGVTSGSLSITPFASNSLIVALVPVDFNTITSVTNGQFQSCFLSQFTGNTPYCENNGIATMQNHATTSFEFVWNLQSGEGPNTGEYVMNWAEFLAPSGPPSNQFPRVQ